MAWPGLAGLGLSRAFYVWLVFKDRVGLGENTLLAVRSSGGSSARLAGVSHRTATIVRLFPKACMCRCVSFSKFGPETKDGQKTRFSVARWLHGCPARPPAVTLLQEGLGNGQVTRASQGDAGRGQRCPLQAETFKASTWSPVSPSVTPASSLAWAPSALTPSRAGDPQRCL